MKQSANMYLSLAPLLQGFRWRAALHSARGEKGEGNVDANSMELKQNTAGALASRSRTRGGGDGRRE